MAVSTAAADTPPVPSQTQDPHRPDPSPENAAQSLTEKVAPHDLTEEDTSRVKVADDIPKAVWLAALVAGSERFAWYGATGPFRKLFGPLDDYTAELSSVQRTISRMTATALCQVR